MILKFGGKVSDMLWMVNTETGEEMGGYVPYDINIGGGDYIEFSVDNETGRIVGWQPISKDRIEEIFTEDTY